MIVHVYHVHIVCAYGHADELKQERNNHKIVIYIPGIKVVKPVLIVLAM